MTSNEFQNLRNHDLSAWAESLAAACREGLRYERWWEARLPIEEIRRQYIAEQVEKGQQALAFGKRLKEAKL